MCVSQEAHPQQHRRLPRPPFVRPSFSQSFDSPSACCTSVMLSPPPPQKEEKRHHSTSTTLWCKVQQKNKVLTTQNGFWAALPSFSITQILQIDSQLTSSQRESAQTFHLPWQIESQPDMVIIAFAPDRLEGSSFSFHAAALQRTSGFQRIYHPRSFWS